MRSFHFVVMLSLAFGGGHSATARAQTFVDVTDASGLDFVHRPTVDHRSGPMSGGGAVADVNGDGYPDLFVLGSGEVSDALFINQRDGRFVDEAARYGLSRPHRGTGAAFGDVDGDGDPDLYVTSFGDTDLLIPAAGQHRLYRNDGGRFTDVAVAAGVAQSAPYPEGYGATFGDIDLDGDLDLFVAGWHVIAGDQAFGSRLFRNRGDGTFEDVSAQSGLLDTSTQAFGAAIVDVDGDRFPELIVAGDFGTSRYLRNNRDGTFTELDPGTGEPVTLATDPNWSIGKAHNGMGLAVGDIDGDLELDVFITAIWPTFHFESAYWGNGLYLHRGDHRFESVAAPGGVADGGWGWGTALADFDHDGRIDIAMTNGWPFDDDMTGESFDGEASYLFMQRADGRFEDAASKAGWQHTLQGRGLLTLDYDRDGDLDMAILSNRGKLYLYRNDTVRDGALMQAPRNQRWLQVALDTVHRPDLAPEGLGANVFIESQGRVQRAWMTQSPSFLGIGETLLHFGVGDAQLIEKLTVRWPSGETTVVRNVRPNRRVMVHAPNVKRVGKVFDDAKSVRLD